MKNNISRGLAKTCEKVIALKPRKYKKAIIDLSARKTKGKGQGLVDISGQDLRGMDLSNVLLSYLVMENADLSYSNCSHNRFDKSHCKGMKIDGADLTGSYFYQIDMSHRDFGRALLKDVV